MSKNLVFYSIHNSYNIKERSININFTPGKMDNYSWKWTIINSTHTNYNLIIKFLTFKLIETFRMIVDYISTSFR